MPARGDQIKLVGAAFGRSEVARSLRIPEWLLAKFSDRRYPYGLVPSVRGTKGRGKKGLYSLNDVYKLALAYRLIVCGFSSRIVAEVLKQLLPKKGDEAAIALTQRATTAQDARRVLLDFSLAPWILDEGKVPEEVTCSPQPARNYI